MLDEHYWEKRYDSVSPDNALVLAGTALLLGVNLLMTQKAAYLL
jgi:hypothetical protein